MPLTQAEHAQIDIHRAAMVREINSRSSDRATLEACYGETWSTKELAEDFIVKAFSAPFCIVRRKSDDIVGTIMFQHNPRFFFAFEAYDGDEPLASLRE